MDLAKIIIKNKNKKPKRLGRGTGSGTGKTAGRGNKGAGQRSGKKLPYIGFSGGNIPYLRKIPKRGFHSPVRKEFQIVNLKDINKRLKNENEVNPQNLKSANLVKDENKPIKILADIKENLSIKATFKADKFSLRAKKLIEDSGGKTECLKR